MASAAFASPLSNFSTTNVGLLLAGVRFASGATAVRDGSKLVLTEGGKTCDFTLAGSVAAGYGVSDHGGGTLITPTGGADASAALVGAMAAFSPSGVPAAGSGFSVVSMSNVLVSEPVASHH